MENNKNCISNNTSFSDKYVVNEEILRSEQLIHKDFLKEVVNIATGSAAISLTDFFKESIVQNIPEIKFIHIEDAYDLIGDLDEEVMILSVDIKGDIRSTLLMVIDSNNIDLIVEKVLPYYIEEEDLLDEQQFEQMKTSILSEIMNIVGNAYFNASSKILDMELKCDIVSMSYDMRAVIVNQLISNLEEDFDELVYCKSEIIIEKNRKDNIQNTDNKKELDFKKLGELMIFHNYEVFKENIIDRFKDEYYG